MAKPKIVFDNIQRKRFIRRKCRKSTSVAVNYTTGKIVTGPASLVEDHVLNEWKYDDDIIVFHHPEMKGQI